MPPPFVSPVSLCPFPAALSTRQTPAVLPRSRKTPVSPGAGHGPGPILALPCYLIHCPRKGNTYPSGNCPVFVLAIDRGTKGESLWDLPFYFVNYHFLLHGNMQLLAVGRLYVEVLFYI